MRTNTNATHENYLRPQDYIAAKFGSISEWSGEVTARTLRSSVFANWFAGTSASHAHVERGPQLRRLLVRCCNPQPHALSLFIAVFTRTVFRKRSIFVLTRCRSQVASPLGDGRRSSRRTRGLAWCSRALFECARMCSWGFWSYRHCPGLRSLPSCCPTWDPRLCLCLRCTPTAMSATREHTTSLRRAPCVRPSSATGTPGSTGKRSCDYRDTPHLGDIAAVNLVCLKTWLSNT